MRNTKLLFLSLVICVFFSLGHAAGPYRVGTTSGNFLELGFGSAGVAMGDAYVSVVNDISSVYWNPAGLGYMEKNELTSNIQPWVVDINFSMGAFAYNNPVLGTFAFSFINTNYGEEDVTTMDYQEGTGETYTGQDLSLQLSYGRKLAQWFSFGVTGKYINSRIWRTSASAFALDFGSIVNTNFLNWTGEPGHGLNIGMSISNYGTRLHYDGKNIKERLDPSENEGNYAYVPVKYETGDWELPLLFRIGVSFSPILTDHHRLILSTDALHPNNNSEYINVGAQYSLNVKPVGEFYLRSGYKGLLMDDAPYGITFGGGLEMNLLNNYGISFDYAARDMGVFGYLHSYSFGFSF